jgi:putative spermidine/putrescine transport system permease protein
MTPPWHRPYPWAVSFAAVLVLLFVVLPLPFIIVYAFSPTAFLVFPPTGVTLHWFENFFANSRFRAALFNSLSISAIATVVTLLAALPTAVMAVRTRFPGRGLLLGLVTAPLVVPGVITGMACLGFLAESGIGIGYWPIVVAMICFTLPLALRPLVGTLAGTDADLEIAARNLGARPLGAFLRVTLPELAPGLVAAGTFVFVEAMDNFSITVFLTDLRTTTLPVEAYSYIRDWDDPTVAAMATLLVALSVVLVFLIEWLLGLDRLLDLK